MSTASRGNAAERFVAKELESLGFLVASRRHIGGAGDLLAVHPGGEVRLIEVKACKSLYGGFRRSDREQMRETLLPLGGERFVANVSGSGAKRKIEWVHEREWPN